MGEYWRSRDPRAVRVTVSLVADSGGLFGNLERIFRGLNEPHGQLVVGIPEAALSDGAHPLIRLVDRLHELDIGVSLVDFGSGATSILQLSKLQFQQLQIPCWVVHEVDTRPEHALIARSIIALAHTLGKSVSADGIATPGELQFFKWEECDIGQGDVLAAQVAADEIAELLWPRTTLSH